MVWHIHLTDLFDAVALRCDRVLTIVCSHRSTLCVSQSLADRCAQKQGAFAARIREYEYREVVAANAEGERLIIIDGTKF